MKLNLGLVAVLLVSLGGPVALVLTFKSMQTNSPLPDCISVLKEEASKVEQKMAIPNSDCGLYLLMQGDKTDRINFLGYVGPKNVEKIKPSMIENGLHNIKLDVVGQCETDGGLVYTLVSGQYDKPEPEPVEPI